MFEIGIIPQLKNGPFAELVHNYFYSYNFNSYNSNICNIKWYSFVIKYLYINKYAKYFESDRDKKCDSAPQSTKFLRSRLRLFPQTVSQASRSRPFSDFWGTGWADSPVVILSFFLTLLRTSYPKLYITQATLIDVCKNCLTISD